jgi:hypothetical protein
VNENPQPLTQEIIDEIFEQANDQGEYIARLYEAALGIEWADIAKVKGHPKITTLTAEYLFQKAIAFDKEHHPNVTFGGYWLSVGFSTVNSEGLDDWMVYPSYCEVVLIEQAPMRGSLEIYEGVNAHYLYGKSKDGTPICLGCLGDDPPDIDPNDEADMLADAYNFTLLEIA